MCGVERPDQSCQGGCVSRLHVVGSDSDKSHSCQCPRAKGTRFSACKTVWTKSFGGASVLHNKITKWPEQAISSNLPTAHVFYFYFYRSSCLWSFLWFLSSVLLHYVYSFLQNIPRAVFLHLTWQFNCTDVTLKAQTTKYLLKDSTLLAFFLLGYDIRAGYSVSLSAEEEKELKEGGGIWVFYLLRTLHYLNLRGSLVTTGHVDGCSQSQVIMDRFLKLLNERAWVKAQY